MAAATSLPSSRKTASKGVRAQQNGTATSTKSNPTVDELREARAAYFSKSAIDREKERKRRPTESDGTKTRSKDAARRRHKSSSSKEKGRERHTKKTISSADYVYDSKRRRNRNPERKRAAQAPKCGVERASISPETRESKELVTSKDATQAGARPQLHRSASTSQSKPEPEKPALHRRDTLGAATAKETNRKSMLGSLFRTSSTPVEKAPTRTVECLTCGADDVAIARSAKLACGHRMCRSCLRRIFTLSIKDPAHMPPRCCTAEHIPLKYVDDLFDNNFKILWNTKYEEYTTKHRLYCPARGCGTWIKPSQVRTHQGRKSGLCGKCKTRCCARCNSKISSSSLGHRRGECPALKEDEDTKKFFETAKEEGWQRCPRCKAMVELKEGCHHISCRCTAEWCFLCTKKWRTCDCPWFNYTNVTDGDRLNHMRVPDIIPILRRHIFGGPEQVAPAPAARRHPQDQNNRNPALRYQEEADERRRQIERDEAFARQLQLNALRNDDEPPRQRMNQEIFGNAGEHFMNENFVQESARVVMGVLGDAAAFGQRGERASGRRKRPNDDNYGPLGPNAFGTESVLGMTPSQPAALRGSANPGNRPDRTSRRGGGDLIGRWLSRL